jgi:phosphopantetheine adenylyltransferase
MGSSFADQAWGRESAVYRVAGVINVIAGWLITAVVALLASGLLALIMYTTDPIGPLVLTVVAGFLLIRSHLVFNRKSKAEKADNQLLDVKQLSSSQAISESKNNTAKTLKTIRQVLVQSLRALLDEDQRTLRKSKDELDKLKIQTEKFDSKIIKFVKKIEKGNILTGRLYILVFDLMQDLYQSVHLINELIMIHVENHHAPPKKKYSELTSTLERTVGDYATKISEHIAAGKGTTVLLQEEQKKLLAHINKSLDDLVTDIQKDDIGNRMGLLQTRVLLELRDIVTVLDQLHVIYNNHAPAVETTKNA